LTFDEITRNTPEKSLVKGMTRPAAEIAMVVSPAGNHEVDISKNIEKLFF
jgi:hypothetical protein